ncbi:MAG TPA: hypothetical protein VN428_13405 [Bryobacteraceae bacterium]|nr:hypothetical protein [Bryobacteraceae bacterium]
MKRLKFIACLPVLALLTGCSEEPKKAAEAAKEAAAPLEPVSAQSAVHQMFMKARAWAPDVKLFRVTAMNLQEVKSEGGKAGAWDATFISESRGRSRRYTYSVIELPASNIHKGPFAGPEDAWSAGGQNAPFVIQALKTDSTAAYDVAVKKSQEYMKKNPTMQIQILLEKTKRFPNPAYRIIWGDSVATSNYSIFVDASTGEYLQTAR